MRARDLAVLSVFFTVFWFGLLGFSGSLTSGFHLTDDHEIAAFSAQVKEAGVFKHAAQWIESDIAQGRLRPVYTFHRVLEMSVLGADPFKWGLYTGALAAITSFFMAVFLCLAGLTAFEAVIFTVLIFTGYQAGIWWRFGPAETIGLFLLSASLVSTALAVRKDCALLDWFSTALLVLFMSVKENFILFVPAVVFLKVWFTEKRYNTGWKAAALKGALPSLALLAVSAALLAFIKFSMGTKGTGYAGYEGLNFKPFMAALLNYSFASHAWLVLAGVFIAFLVLPGRRLAAEAFPLSVFLVLALIPQAIVYAKSGVSERYILPGAFGFLFFAAGLSRIIREGASGRTLAPGKKQMACLAMALLSIGLGVWMARTPKFTLVFNAERLEFISGFRHIPSLTYIAGPVFNASRWLVPALAVVFVVICAAGLKIKGVFGKVFSLKYALPALSIWLVIFNGSLSFDQAFGWALDGWSSNEWISAIKDSSGKDEPVLVVADPAVNNEWALAVKRFLNASGRTELYAFPVDTRPSYSKFERTLRESFGSMYGDRTVAALPLQVKTIAIFPGAEDAFLSKARGFDPSQYKRFMNELGFVLYVRAYQPLP